MLFAKWGRLCAAVSTRELEMSCACKQVHEEFQLVHEKHNTRQGSWIIFAVDYFTFLVVIKS